MERFKDKHKGKRIWVCGSGGSLLDVDPSRIPKQDIIIACNSATYHFETMNYAVFTDESVNYNNYYTNLNKKKCKIILFNNHIDIIKRGTIVVQKQYDVWEFTKTGNKVIGGRDVIHCAVHLAWQMGAGQIILAGVDLKHKDAGHKYAYPNTYNANTPEGLRPTLDESMKANDTLFDGHLGYSLGGWEEINKANPSLPITTIAVNGNLHIYPKKAFNELV